MFFYPLANANENFEGLPTGATCAADRRIDEGF
jgi:hypothetical protein